MKKWADMTGRERDVLVAETLGWQRVYHDVDRDGEYAHGIATDGSGAQWDNIPHYSTDRASAMTLLDDAHGYVVGKSTDGHFYCIIIDKDYEYHRAPSQNSNAEAICLAFLLYKGVEIE